MEPAKENKRQAFINNFVGGLGWMVGATFGFTIFVLLISLLFKLLGGLPIIGDFFASLIEVTNQALETKRIIGK